MDFQHLRILHGLNNVDYGAWEGMTAEEAAMFDPEAFALYRASPSQAACPLGERLSDAQQRMIDADASVALERIPPVVPEGVNPLVRMEVVATIPLQAVQPEA